MVKKQKMVAVQAIDRRNWRNEEAKKSSIDDRLLGWYSVQGNLASEVVKPMTKAS